MAKWENLFGNRDETGLPNQNAGQLVKLTRHVLLKQNAENFMDSKKYQ